MVQQLYCCETVATVFVLQPSIFSKYLKYLIDAVLGNDGFICYDVGWWGKFNRGSNGVNGVDIGHGDIMEGTGTNNQVSPSYGALIGSFIVVVNVGRIL